MIFKKVSSSRQRTQFESPALEPVSVEEILGGGGLRSKDSSNILLKHAKCQNAQARDFKFSNMHDVQMLVPKISDVSNMQNECSGQRFQISQAPWTLFKSFEFPFFCSLWPLCKNLKNTKALKVTSWSVQCTRYLD